jgi:hypothetical protein
MRGTNIHYFNKKVYIYFGMFFPAERQNSVRLFRTMLDSGLLWLACVTISGDVCQPAMRLSGSGG